VTCHSCRIGAVKAGKGRNQVQRDSFFKEVGQPVGCVLCLVYLN
jgi:hypothetical protein